MTSLMFSTFVYDNLSQFSYHHVHQVCSVFSALTVRSEAKTLCSKSSTLADTFGCEALERLSGLERLPNDTQGTSE